jgi:hypothetical protein
MCIYIPMCVKINYHAVYFNYISKVFPQATYRRQGGEDIYLLVILDLGTRCDNISASRPVRVLAAGNDPGTRWIGGWVNLRDGLDIGSKGEILCLCRGSNPGHHVCSQTLY